MQISNRKFPDSDGKGKVFWYPPDEFIKSDKLIDGFEEMLSVFTDNDVSEVFYERTDDGVATVFC